MLNNANTNANANASIASGTPSTGPPTVTVNLFRGGAAAGKRERGKKKKSFTAH